MMRSKGQGDCHFSFLTNKMPAYNKKIKGTIVILAYERGTILMKINLLVYLLFSFFFFLF